MENSLKRVAEETALKLFLPVGLITAAVGYIYNYNYEALPVLGLHSIGLPIIVAALLATGVFFAYGYLKSLSLKAKKPIGKVLTPRNTFDTFALSLTHAILTTVFVALIIILMNYAFKGLYLDRLSSAFILGLSTAVLVYLMVTLAMSVTIESVTGIVLGFFGVGVLASMLATDNPDWWQHNFSYLGTFESGVTKVFNATFVITSLVMLVLVNFLFSSVRPAFAKDKKVKMKNFEWVERLFIIAAICLGGVGLFSYSRSPLFHNLSAMFLAISFGTMMIAMRWLIPVFAKSFYTISYILVALLFLGWAVLLNGIGYINLTAYELLAAALCGIWVGLFLRSLALKQADSA